MRGMLQRVRSRRSESPWRPIVGRGWAAPTSGERGRVLCATSVGGHPIAPLLDGLVGTALALRGADVSFLLCDGALPACEQCAYVAFPNPEEFVAQGPQARLCAGCFGRGSRFLSPLPLPVRRYGEFSGGDDGLLRPVDRWTADECMSFEHDGLRLGEQARAGVLRFFGKADLESEPEELVLAVARRYAAGALRAAEVAERAFHDVRPDVVVAHHGVYVPQGVLGEVARRDGVRVVNWGTSYRDRTVIFSHGDSYHRTFLDEPRSSWDAPISEAQERELLDFLAERRRGEGDWAWVTPEAALRREEQRSDDLREALGLDPELPTFGLLTNVLWDAQLYYAGHAFEHMLEWLWFTIDDFAARPDRQLVIRIHPHEIKAGNRQPVGPELARRYPELPQNVHLVPHDSPLNTYALMQLCRAVLIYGTKTGVELTPLGIPVIVAGEAWIRGKGITIDVDSKEAYARALADLPALEPLDDETVARARRYAYHYFFRRMIPITSFAPATAELRLDIESVDELRPGIDPGLDTICRGILDGDAFAFDG